MPSVEIRIPQLGEGLQEARIVRFLKQPGDAVAMDEPIYEMETDKAVMEIESPAAGFIEAWVAKEDDVLPIGAAIGRISSESSAKPPAPGEESPEFVLPDAEAPKSASPSLSVPSASLRAGRIAPRTRAYARQKGLSDEDLLRLAASAEGRLMPEEIDRYLQNRAASDSGTQAERGAGPAAPARPAARESAPGEGAAWRDAPLQPRQRTLVYRLQQGTREVVAATMEVRLSWSPVEAARARVKQAGGALQPTQFLLFAWCVARAAALHPAFRSALLDESTVREYAHLNLGIAVARPNDELLLARIDAADTLNLEQFTAAAHAAIEKARQGQDQASEVMPLSLTNMAGAGVRMGIPVLVAPAAGTLFVGEPFDEAYPLPGGGIGFRRQAAMSLTFDHRLANGAGAARFLAEIRRLVESLPDSLA